MSFSPDDAMTDKKRTRVAFVQREWEDNLGLLWIVAALKQHGFTARIWVGCKDTCREIADFAPDIVGYSCTTGAHPWVLASVDRLKAAGIEAMIVVGGPHATFFPDFIQDPRLDAMCRGEGEEAMVELASALEEGREPYGIQNWQFNVDGKIIENHLRPLVEDLDSLPDPDRSYYRRYPLLAKNPFRIFITGRGCPFKCTFCFNHALVELYGKTAKYVRRRCPASVVEEILRVKSEWGLDQIRFSDDHFVLSKNWLREFCELYKREVGRPYTVNARADVLCEERVTLLAESGCRLVCFGLETGREDLRNEVLKKRISNEHIITAAQRLRSHGIKLLTSNIIGLPGETVEDAWQTIALNQRIKTNLPWFSMMQYYPGTEVYEQAVAAGLLGENFCFDGVTSYFRNDYLQQDNMGELQSIHSFSILAVRFKFLEPLARRLSRSLPPNVLFRLIFKLSYFVMSVKRADFRLLHLIRAFPYFVRKMRAG